jgi:ElaB/YqjD/DUF883 family membrane-anchored ribosome-binding protein
MNTEENKTSREIEHDVERTRARMTDTLDELRARMSPGQIVDEVLDYARDSGGGKMVQNLGRTVQDNPAPLLLIGAGVAWMMATSGSRSRDEQWYPRADREGNVRADREGNGNEPVDEGSSWADAAASIGESVRHAGEQMSDTVSGMASAAADAASSVRDSAARTMHDLRDRASSAGGPAYRKSRDMGGNIASMLNEQPFMLGALGVALGVALGAALPETEAEDSLMGEASDAVKEQASKGYEKAKAVAKKTLDKVADEAQAQGLSTGKAEGVLGELASKAGAVFETAKDAAIDEASRQGLVDDAADNSGPSGEPTKGGRKTPSID